MGPTCGTQIFWHVRWYHMWAHICWCGRVDVSMWVPQFACVLAYVAQQRYIWTSSVALSTSVAFANLIIFIIIMRDPNLLTWPVWDPHVGPTLFWRGMWDPQVGPKLLTWQWWCQHIGPTVCLRVLAYVAQVHYMWSILCCICNFQCFYNN